VFVYSVFTVSSVCIYSVFVVSSTCVGYIQCLLYHVFMCSVFAESSVCVGLYSLFAVSSVYVQCLLYQVFVYIPCLLYLVFAVDYVGYSIFVAYGHRVRAWWRRSSMIRRIMSSRSVSLSVQSWSTAQPNTFDVALVTDAMTFSTVQVSTFSEWPIGYNYTCRPYIILCCPIGKASYIYIGQVGESGAS